MSTEDRDTTRAEARVAGERALTSLSEAMAGLKRASSWGLVDIFGGNVLSGVFKYTGIKHAKESLAQARAHVSEFSKLLGLVDGMESVQLDIGDFLTFADFFFDGAIADILVQAKIEDAKTSVRKAYGSIKQALQNLDA